MVDWRVSSVNACVTEDLRNGKECGENDDVNVGGSGSDDDTNKDVEVVEISTVEALTMLDKLVNLNDLSKDER